jgi:hypothetical protein
LALEATIREVLAIRLLIGNCLRETFGRLGEDVLLDNHPALEVEADKFVQDSIGG